MSLIDSNSRFAVNPTNIRGIQRSKFDMSHTVKTTFNVGELIPFDVLEVLPGDTFNIETNILARLQTLITPLMDDLYLDTYYFFVPNRLVWEHWKEFNGENTKNAWYPSTTYTVPQLTIKGNDDLNGSILDYMGIPTNTKENSNISLSINVLPIRAYNLIYNEWFRDQNLQDPVLVSVNDSTVAFNKDDSCFGGKPLMATKYHDYFTSALPNPQKGPDVTLPLTNSGLFPVGAIAGKKITDYGYTPNDETQMTFSLSPKNGVVPTVSNGGNRPLYFNTQTLSPASSGEILVRDQNEGNLSGQFYQSYPDNLFVNLQESSVATINSLRLAFATQQLYELDARGGTRYVEILKAHFGVTSPDARQQRPELLGYNHTPISVNQVVQQSGTNSTTALGDVAGLSVTADSDNSFVKSFTEHGFVIGICCARYKHSYQQGLNRIWSRQTRFDYYWPVFANIGEQPILNKEIYMNYSLTKDTSGNTQNENDEVFGYQEAWAEYRYIPDRVSGEMRSDYKQSLDVWHLADDYSELPRLSDEWIQENPTTVNRVLSASDNIAAQVFMDIYLKMEATRPMPMYSVPGLTRM